MKLSRMLPWLLLLAACKPVSESYDTIENAVTYTASNQKNNPMPLGEIKLMSWNIRFGIARNNWFGDACGLNTLFAKSEIEANLKNITGQINLVNPDILMVQECDVNSKRSAYTYEIDYLLPHTSFNYVYFGPMWQSQFIPRRG